MADNTTLAVSTRPALLQHEALCAHRELLVLLMPPPALLWLLLLLLGVEGGRAFVLPPCSTCISNQVSRVLRVATRTHTTHLDTKGEPLRPAAPLLQRLCIGGLRLQAQHLPASTQLCHHKGGSGVEVPQLLTALLDVGQVPMQCIHLDLDLQEPQGVQSDVSSGWVDWPPSR